MNKLLHFLKQPYPVVHKRWQVVVISALIVLFVLAAFQPFGLDKIKHKILHLTGFMFVTAIGVSFVIYILPLLFKRFYNENWTIGKNILNSLFIIIVISLGNTIYSFLTIFRHKDFSWNSFFTMLIYYVIVTSLVSVIPYIVISFFQFNNSLKRNLEEAQELNQKLSVRNKEIKDDYLSNPIILSGNTKDSTELHPEQILSLEAYGNYVKVNYKEGESSRQKLLRATIKQMEDQLTDYPYILRCHRAFLVNIKQVQTVRGNSQGYRLVINHLTDEIPVSRAYAKAFRDHLG